MGFRSGAGNDHGSGCARGVTGLYSAAEKRDRTYSNLVTAIPSLLSYPQKTQQAAQEEDASGG